MGRMIPTPNERAAIKQFLHECTDLHIDGADFTGHARAASGDDRPLPEPQGATRSRKT
jgi:hypothetical protein